MTEQPTRWERAKKAYAIVGDILTPGRIVLLLGALIILVAGLFGGWERVTAADHDTPTAEPSTPVEAAPFEFTVHRLRIGDELPPIATASEQHRYLFLLLDVTNTSDQPVPLTVLQRAVTLDFEGWEDEAPQNFRALDSGMTRYFQPGVVTPSALVWQLDRTAPPPTEVAVTLNAHTWRYSIVEEDEGWFDEEPAAQLTMPADPLEEQ